MNWRWCEEHSIEMVTIQFSPYNNMYDRPCMGILTPFALFLASTAHSWKTTLHLDKWTSTFFTIAHSQSFQFLLFISRSSQTTTHVIVRAHPESNSYKWQSAWKHAWKSAWKWYNFTLKIIIFLGFFMIFKNPIS